MLRSSLVAAAVAEFNVSRRRHRLLNSISLSPTALHDNEVSVSATSDVAASRTSTTGSRRGYAGMVSPGSLPGWSWFGPAFPD
ncbi:hypothetical protein HMPREF9582_00973 [Cutibacterium acnes HL060PA1]|nr:hypothetical protein HMPREF9603_01452 [Cutibacterium acnes HL001PA1]EFT11021.1 hypothetical protein HMPREF9619_00882 [Cutibacterium acnes HL082PA2]EFT25358.1 hypothetical protein HMPREF9577_02226 [Cutibacterium acnes HL110PA3]EFT63809.1 hypothetical protein HMPREF9578_00445 [Cutibacterium acnes HL110PA4]EFT65136.1 hypothetical protein HMPREF9582_00973 [Cutibacterium acnes HL060PA1]